MTFKFDNTCCLPIDIPSDQAVSKSFFKSLKYYLSILLSTALKGAGLSSQAHLARQIKGPCTCQPQHSSSTWSCCPLWGPSLPLLHWTTVKAGSTALHPFLFIPRKYFLSINMLVVASQFSSLLLIIIICGLTDQCPLLWDSVPQQAHPLIWMIDYFKYLWNARVQFCSKRRYFLIIACVHVLYCVQHLNIYICCWIACKKIKMH